VTRKPLVRTGGRPQPVDPPVREDTADGWAWVGVAVCTAAAVLAALVESMLIPLYVGSVIIPLAPLLAIGLNVLLVYVGRFAVHRMIGGLLPFLGWLAPVLILSGVPRPEGDVIYPGGSGLLAFVSYGVVLGGGLAGAGTLVLTAPQPTMRSGVGR
jgi:hypothetical protein